MTDSNPFAALQNATNSHSKDESKKILILFILINFYLQRKFVALKIKY